MYIDSGKRFLYGLLFTLFISNGVAYPLGSWVTDFRTWFSSRLSQASDEEIEALEKSPEMLSQMQAMQLKVTRADFAYPFVSEMVSEELGFLTAAPIKSIIGKTAFSTIYKWFAKRAVVKDIPCLIGKGIITSAAIFSFNQITQKFLHPRCVKNNYYATTFANRLGIKIAIIACVALLGFADEDNAELSV